MAGLGVPLEEVRGFIGENPGVTIRAISEEFGLYPQYVYRVVLRRMEEEGFLLAEVEPRQEYQPRGRGRRATMGFAVLGG